jgi:hypothetical protein
MRNCSIGQFFPEWEGDNTGSHNAWEIKWETTQTPTLKSNQF